MSVFDGSTFRLTIYREGEDWPEEKYTDYPAEFVEAYRNKPEVRAVETHKMNMIEGPLVSAYSFGDPEGEEDE